MSNQLNRREVKKEATISSSTIESDINSSLIGDSYMTTDDTKVTLEQGAVARTSAVDQAYWASKGISTNSLIYDRLVFGRHSKIVVALANEFEKGLTKVLSDFATPLGQKLDHIADTAEKQLQDYLENFCSASFQNEVIREKAKLPSAPSEFVEEYEKNKPATPEAKKDEKPVIAGL